MEATSRLTRYHSWTIESKEIQRLSVCGAKQVLFCSFCYCWNSSYLIQSFGVYCLEYTEMGSWQYHPVDFSGRGVVDCDEDPGLIWCFEDKIPTKKPQECSAKHASSRWRLLKRSCPKGWHAGVKQIIQILSVNIWPNVVIKNDKSQGFIQPAQLPCWSRWQL